MLLLFPRMGQDICRILHPIPPTNQWDSEVVASGVAVTVLALTNTLSILKTDARQVCCPVD